MSETELHLLRWRGQTSGPYPWPVILKMLDEHEIGLWHEVQDQDRWLTLGDLLRERSTPAADAPAPRKKPIKVPPPPGTEMETVLAGPTQVIAPPAAVTREIATPPASRADAVSGARRYRPKRLRVFAALGMGLGFAGAHNFYAGYRATGLAQLLLSALTFWLGFGFVLTWLWAFIELLLVHTDVRGVRMT